MRHIFRRPFDYPQHRQEFNLWAMQGLVEAQLTSSAFTSHAAAITSAAPATTQSSRSTRYSSGGVFRTRWPYAQHHARVLLTYKDADSIEAERAGGAFLSFVAEVRLGSSTGASINAQSAQAAYSTHPAEVSGGKRDPIADAIGSLTTYQASIARTAGLGVSRTGHVSATPTGPYTRGSSRGRPARRPPPPIGTITKLK